VKLLPRLDRLVRTLVDDYAGHVVKNQGDGYMIAFGYSEQAVRCGVDAQSGIHTGTSVRRGDDLFGRNVAMAARVAGHAEGGEILISESVRDAIGELPDIQFSAPREVELKGLRGTHKVFLVSPISAADGPSVKGVTSGRRQLVTPPYGHVGE
jgi:adenylate cyclase